MGRVRGAVNARALSLARKEVDLCNCWRREATAEGLVEKQVELVSFAEDPVMVVATLRLDVALAGGVVERTLTTANPRCLQPMFARRARSSVLPKANLSPILSLSVCISYVHLLGN